MKSLKPTFFDIFFDLIFLGTCLIIGTVHLRSGLYLKALTFGGFATLTLWSFVVGMHASAEIKKFESHLLFRMFRILIGGGILLYLSKDLILAHPFVALSMISVWLVIGWHSSARHDALQAQRRQLLYPIQEKKFTSPGQKFTASDLIPGKTYSVIKEFTDYYGNLHLIGESWQFMEKHFLPYDDGLTLRGQRDGQDIWVYLQWRKETQGEIIDNFHMYVEEK
ncbi:MAG: DUF3601 domain-containing protein [Anaerolineales bacterium]